jgi:polyisoprenoid-binding protein YceI
MTHARSMTLPLLLFAASFVAAAQQPAQPHSKPSPSIPASRNIEIHLDPHTTQIHFKVGSMLRDVRGSFQFKGGAIAIDPDSTLAQGELLADATTVHTGSSSRDRDVQQQILESSRYPSIFFHIEHLRGKIPEKDGSADVIAEGTLNIHGADHSMQMRVHLVRVDDKLTATTRFTVPYVEWGMKQPHSLVHMSKTVQVDVSARGTIRSVATIHNGAQSNDSDEEGPS